MNKQAVALITVIIVLMLPIQYLKFKLLVMMETLKNAIVKK